MSKKGFTLVELLIVVAIIGVLSVMGMTAYSGVQQKARDTKRRADIDAIAKVMESNYNVKTASYPALTDLASGFSNNQLPVSPKDGDYVISLDGKAFIACAKMEGTSLTAQQCLADRTNSNCYCKGSSSASVDNIVSAASAGGYLVDTGSTITINSSGTTTPYDYAIPDCTPCAADFNRDGTVDQTDSSTWKYCKDYGIDSNAVCSNVDIQRNGQIDQVDYNCWKQQLSKQCPSRLQKYVFVTSGEYSGDLGGSSGADAKCNALARSSNNNDLVKQAGQSNKFMAWLSGPATRFATKSSSPYKLVDGTIVANNWNDLITSKSGNFLINQINKDENGGLVTGDTKVWTSTQTNGTIIAFGNNYVCSGWTIGQNFYCVSGSCSGRVGYYGVFQNIDSSWTSSSYQYCGGVARLYCFEQ